MKTLTILLLTTRSATVASFEVAFGLLLLLLGFSEFDNLWFSFEFAPECEWVTYKNLLHRMLPSRFMLARVTAAGAAAVAGAVTVILETLAV